MADKYNAEATEILANEALHLAISEAVPIYEQLLATFPTAVSLVTMQRVMSGIISMTFLSLSKAVTIGEAFFIFMAMAMIGCLFIYMLLPETQGKTLEELQNLFCTFFKWRSTMRELEKNKPFNSDDVTGNGQVQLEERHG